MRHSHAHASLSICQCIDGNAFLHLHSSKFQPSKSISPIRSYSLLPFYVLAQTIRVAIMQGTLVATQYSNDQLKEDLDRDELVAKGKVSRHDANADGVEWAEVRGYMYMCADMLVGVGMYECERRSSTFGSSPEMLLDGVACLLLSRR